MLNAPTSLEQKPSKMIRFFSHPAVGLTGTLASVVGLLLAVYFFLAARAVPHLTAYVHPVRATVVKADQSSALTVLYDRKLVPRDITAAQIALWNAGKQPLRAPDVLTPITIHVSAPILEATIRKKSRAAIIVHLDRRQLASGDLGVTWNILEQNDGVILQLIYASTPAAKITANGTVIGQGDIENVAYFCFVTLMNGCKPFRMSGEDVPQPAIQTVRGVDFMSAGRHTAWSSALIVRTTITILSS